MIILALDTTADVASVALRQHGRTIAEETAMTSDGHSHLLFSMLQAVFEKAGLTLPEVDCFASARGPGSFTGVRLCLTASKGLAEAMGRPAVGVSTLRALATFGTAPLRNPRLDARRGHIYTAIYDANLSLLSEEIVIAAAAWNVAPDVEQITVQKPLAAAIAFCAELDGPATWHDPALLDACYVRRADPDAVWVDVGQRVIKS